MSLLLLLRSPAPAPAFQSSAVTRTGELNIALTANAPAGVVANDVLLASISADTTLSTLAVNWTGWTEIARQYISAPDGQLLVLMARVATGTENYSVSTSGATGIQATIVIARFSGVNPVLPTNFSTTVNTVNNASPISISLNGLTAATNSTIVAFGTLDQTAATDTWSHSTISGYTLRVNDAGGDWNTTQLQTRDNVTLGATGALACTATIVSGTGGAGYAGIVVELPVPSTKLYLRSTKTNGIGATYYDLDIVAGAASDTAVVDTALNGTEIQFTKTSGGAIAQFISGRAPVGGFTLTNTDISVWLAQSSLLNNAGGRYRIFKRTAAGVETDITGTPFDNGIEATAVNAEYTWAGNVTDTLFSEDERVLLKVYVTNIGVMAMGTVTLNFNAADTLAGDSFLTIYPKTVFKAVAVLNTKAEFLLMML